MVVLGLGVEDLAEEAVLDHLAHEHGRRSVVARLCHHVADAIALLGRDELLAFLQADGRRHGADAVLPRVHHLHTVADVVGGAGEDGDGIEAVIKDELLERVVRPIAAVSAHQVVASITSEVADSGDDAVGVQMPLECGAEASAHHADPYLAVVIGPARPAILSLRPANAQGSNADGADGLDELPSREPRCCICHLSGSLLSGAWLQPLAACACL